MNGDSPLGMILAVILGILVIAALGSRSRVREYDAGMARGGPMQPGARPWGGGGGYVERPYRPWEQRSMYPSGGSYGPPYEPPRHPHHPHRPHHQPPHHQPPHHQPPHHQPPHHQPPLGPGGTHTEPEGAGHTVASTGVTIPLKPLHVNVAEDITGGTPIELASNSPKQASSVHTVPPSTHST